MNVSEQLDHISRGAARIVSTDELEAKLESSLKTDRPLRVKLGLDPNSAEVHLGHAVVLRKLRQFQDLGHKAVVVIGDFTAPVGDPSCRSERPSRPTAAEVEANGLSYVQQLGRIIDISHAEVVFNGSWYRRMGLDEFLGVCSRMGVGEFSIRPGRGEEDEGNEADDFVGGLDEFLYPLLQAYDSVVVEADVEIGGTDQTDNLLLARRLQGNMGLTPQVALMMPLLEGTDGKLKMSASFGNHVALSGKPSQIYGQLMSMHDVSLRRCFELLTDVSEDEIAGLLADDADLSAAREMLAHELISQYYNRRTADDAGAEFRRALARHEMPDDVPTRVVPTRMLTDGKIGIVELLLQCDLADGPAQARRAVSRGRTYIDGHRVTDVEARITPRSGCIVQVGSRRFAKVKIKVR